jgi:hypothetical protein
MAEPSGDLLGGHTTSYTTNGGGELDVDGESPKVGLHVRSEHLDGVQLSHELG